MFKEVFYPLVKFFTPFNIFQYITFRAAYAALSALLITFICAPLIIRYLRKKKLGEGIRADGPQTHLGKAGTPTMGGLMIVLSTVLAVVLWQDLRQLYTWLGLLTILGFGGIGFLDDYIKVFRKKKEGLSGKAKLILQFSVSFVICLLFYLYGNSDYATKIFVPFFKESILDLGPWYIPFGMLLMVWFSNAVNLSDGLDGLATGLVLMATLALGLIAYATGRIDWSGYLLLPFIPEASEMTVLAFALVGACVGFLWYNSSPAEIFMGDTGSLMMGGTLAFLSMTIKKEILLFIIGGVFVIEAVSVVLQVASYKLRKKRIFLMAPLHHHFELKGWAETKVVMRFWILGGMFAILGLSTLKII